jgi:hypothetical protein
MSNISFTEITDGSNIDASDVNGPLNTIYDDYNGNIDSNNLATNAVTTAKITDANVTVPKLSNPYKARAYRNGAQSNLTDNTSTKVQLNAENYDINSNFDTSNYRYTAPVTGYYNVNARISYSGTIASKLYMAQIYVNGSIYTLAYSANGADGNGVHDVAISDIVYAEAGQYIELYAKVLCGANTVDISGTSINTFMAIHLLSM